MTRLLDTLGRLDCNEADFGIDEQHRIITIGDVKYVALYCDETVSIPIVCPQI
jgi:hypothetical protein